MPERDIGSLGAMGKGGWRRPGDSSAAAAVAVVAPPPIKSENPKSSYFFFKKSLIFHGHTVKKCEKTTKKETENQNLRSGPPDSADRSVSSS